MNIHTDILEASNFSPEWNEYLTVAINSSIYVGLRSWAGPRSWADSQIVGRFPDRGPI